MSRAPGLTPLLLLAACAAPPTEQPPFLALDGGVSQVLDGGEQPLRGGLEVWWRPQGELGLVPVLGATLFEDGANRVHVEVRRDFWIDERWVFTPSFGPGVYHLGDRTPLGSSIQFRSGFGIAYRFRSEARLGLRYLHISNAGFGEHNPGTEVLLLSLALPIG